MHSSTVGRILEERTENSNRIGLVEFAGKHRSIYLNFVPDARVGDCVRFHAGFATELIAPCEANGASPEAPREPGIESIQAYRLLSELDPRQLRKLLPLATERQFEPGEIIFSAGEKSLFLHLIVSGDVSLEDESDGQVTQVFTLHAGDAMGWSALTADAVTHFRARALTPVSTIAFPGADVQAACDLDPAMGYALMRRLLELVTERLDATRMRLAEIGRSAGSAARSERIAG